MRGRSAAAAFAVLLALAVGWAVVRAVGRDDSPPPAADADVSAGTGAPRPPNRRVRAVVGDARADEIEMPPPGAATAESSPARETAGRDAVRAWAGRVTDLRGVPIAGAEVWARSEFGPVRQYARTAEDGSFRLDCTRAVWTRLDVTADGFAPWNWDAWPGREDLIIRLARLVVVRGTVVHADGTPAADAKVNHVAKTDAMGRFETTLSEGRSQGLYAAWGRSPGDAGDAAESGHAWIDVDPATPPREVRVVLDTVWTWVGVLVTSENGRPLDGATVWFRPHGGTWRGMDTGGTGRAAITIPAQAGTVVDLIVEGPVGWADATGSTTSRAAAGDPVTITLRRAEKPATPPLSASPPAPTATVTVRVGDVAALARSADVFVYDSLSVRREHGWCDADRDSFTCTVHAPSRVVASIESGGRAWVGTATVVPGDDIRLECAALLPLRRVRGRVTGPDGAPLAGAPVDAGVSPSCSHWDGDVDTCTDASGRFEVLAADSDLVWVSARSDGFAPAFVRIGAKNDTEVQVRLARGGSVEVRPAGDDYVGSEANVTSAAAAGPGGDCGGTPRKWTAVGESTQSGMRFDDLPAGRWRLRIEVRGRTCEVIADVRVGETTVVTAPAWEHAGL